VNRKAAVNRGCRVLCLIVSCVLPLSTALAQPDYSLAGAKGAFGECKAVMDELAAAGKRNDAQWRPVTQCVRMCASLVQALEGGRTARGAGPRCARLYEDATGDRFPEVAVVPTPVSPELPEPESTPTYPVEASIAEEFTTRKNDCARYVGSEQDSVATDALECVSECRVPIYAHPRSASLHRSRCAGKHGSFMRNYVPRISAASAEQFTGITATLEYLDSWASLQDRQGGYAWKVVSSSDPSFKLRCPVVGYHAEMGGGGNVQGNQAENVSQWNLSRVATSASQAPGKLGAQCFVIDMEPLGGLTP